MSKLEVQPNLLQLGDHVVINNQECVLKYVDTPDARGTVDLYVTDQQGRDQHAIVTGAVTIVV
jgi:hypothetical protein